MERFIKQLNEYTSKQDMKRVESRHFCLVYSFTCKLVY